MNSRNTIYWLLVAALMLVFAAAAIAQDTSQTTVTQGQSVQEAQVEKGEVVYVSGNDLVIRMENGEIRHITAPEDATATVDGKEITVKDVKPGMVLQRTITTTTTPEVVKTVRTIEGKVWHVNPPSTVILQLPDGTNKTYRVPKDQKFTINGQETNVFDLKKGMMVSATVITEVPQTVAEQERQVAGTMPPPPVTPPVQGALLIEQPQPTAPAPVVEQAALPQELPKTGSIVPLLGFLGLLSFAASFGLRSIGK